MTSVSAGAYADMPLVLLHLAEYLDIDYELDVAELNERWAPHRRRRRVEPARSSRRREADVELLTAAPADRDLAARRRRHGDLSRPRQRLARDPRRGRGVLPAGAGGGRVPLPGRRPRPAGRALAHADRRQRADAARRASGSTRSARSSRASRSLRRPSSTVHTTRWRSRRNYAQRRMDAALTFTAVEEHYRARALPRALARAARLVPARRRRGAPELRRRPARAARAHARARADVGSADASAPAGETSRPACSRSTTRRRCSPAARRR